MDWRKLKATLIRSGRQQNLVLFRNDEWIVATTKLREVPLSVYMETALHIVSLVNNPEEHVLIGSILEYITFFNEVWTSTFLSQRCIASCRQHEERIEFSSHSKKFSWLSNMFPSIIIDAEYNRAYMNVETGYAIFKVMTLECRDREYEDNRESLIAALLSCTDGKKAKQLTRSFIRKSSIEDTMAIGEITRLTRLKYTQNSVLRQLLMDSGDAMLCEHTSDAFWGTANGTVFDENSNHFGRILTYIREELLSTSHK